MIDKNLFPTYTPREKQQKQVEKLVSLVQEDSQSRTILLYGAGGVGKTYFVRNLPENFDADYLKWVGPIDLDDSEFWSLIHLKLSVAQHLGKAYFQEYFTHLSQYKQQQIDTEEKQAAYQYEENRLFLQAYKEFLDKSGKIPLIILDTVEAIRGVDVVAALIDWMKQLPNTVFILSGRPVVDNEQEDEISKTLKFSPEMPCDTVRLEGFSPKEGLAYLNSSGIIAGLDSDAEFETRRDAKRS